MKLWGWLLGGAVALAAAASAAYAFRAEIALALVARTAPEAVGANLARELGDGLHAVFCGTGSPLPDRSRAGPCLAVIAGDQMFVFDAGEGASETLSLMGVVQGDIDAVFLTHLHSDHIDGLAPLALQHWATVSATSPLVVVGLPGTSRVVAGFNEAYAIDDGYRTAHHGPQIMPPSGAGLVAEEFSAPTVDGETVLLRDVNGVRVLAFKVDHDPVPAVGYRVEYAGRSIVISGDTARSHSLAVAAHGADLLVHEALSPQLDAIMHDAAANSGRAGVAQILHDILDYHSSPEDAGAVAQEAGVGALALTHIVPQTPIAGLAAVFERDARKTYSGPVWVARDGDVVSLPRSGGLVRSHRLRFE